MSEPQQNTEGQQMVDNALDALKKQTAQPRTQIMSPDPRKEIDANLLSAQASALNNVMVKDAARMQNPLTREDLKTQGGLRTALQRFFNPKDPTDQKK